jgi:hypothetical protein
MLEQGENVRPNTSLLLWQTKGEKKTGEKERQRERERERGRETKGVRGRESQTVLCTPNLIDFIK